MANNEPIDDDEAEFDVEQCVGCHEEFPPGDLDQDGYCDDCSAEFDDDDLSA